MARKGKDEDSVVLDLGEKDAVKLTEDLYKEGMKKKKGLFVAVVDPRHTSVSTLNVTETDIAHLINSLARNFPDSFAAVISTIFDKK